MRSPAKWLAIVAALLAAGTISAQTTTPGDAIDVEVYNPVDGSNQFCYPQGETFWAHVYVRPATGPGTSFDCALDCGTTQGGPANIAAAVIDVGFDGDKVQYAAAETNPDAGYAAVDGVVQDQHLDQNRIGWALYGDWDPDGTPGGTLASPCAMAKLDSAGWVYRMRFDVIGSGTSQLGLRGEPGFAFSLADICGSEAYKVSNGGIDEVVAATVSTDCGAAQNMIFSNGFETGDTSLWSATNPG